MRFITRVWISYILLSVVYQCTSDVSVVNKEISPLDEILADKLLDASTNKIRQNNFQDYFKLTESELKIPSKYYDVQQLINGVYLLQYKKDHHQVRRFNALLKFTDNKVSNYKVLQDFKAIDWAIEKDMITVLCDNFNYYDEYWTKNQGTISIIQYDTSLKKQWEYRPNNGQVILEGLDVNKSSNRIEVTANLITGCQICTHTLLVTLNNSGNCIEVVELSSNNSSINLDEKQLKKIFIK